MRTRNKGNFRTYSNIRSGTNRVANLDTNIARHWTKHSKDNSIPFQEVYNFLSLFIEEDLECLLVECYPHYSPQHLLSLEEFKNCTLGVCRKANLYIDSLPPLSKTDIMNHFKMYTEIPFLEEPHNNLVIQLWQLAFPDTHAPDIPSKEWEKLGFQGTNPSTDFRGSGRCGIDSLLALAKQRDFFLLLKASADHHGIPFATAGINVVMMIFEFLGWGFKSPRVPSGNRPQTYVILCKLIFGLSSNEHSYSEVLENTKRNFFKVYYLVFGLLAGMWQEMKGSYFDFPRIIVAASNVLEKKLQKLSELLLLERYLIENYSIDISLLDSENVGRIFLCDKKNRLITNNDLECSIEDNLSKLWKDKSSEYTVYDWEGNVVQDTKNTLKSIPRKIIFVYPAAVSYTPPKRMYRSYSTASLKRRLMEKKVSTYPVTNPHPLITERRNFKAGLQNTKLLILRENYKIFTQIRTDPDSLSISDLASSVLGSTKSIAFSQTPSTVSTTPGSKHRQTTPAGHPSPRVTTVVHSPKPAPSPNAASRPKKLVSPTLKSTPSFASPSSRVSRRPGLRSSAVVSVSPGKRPLPLKSHNTISSRHPPARPTDHKSPPRSLATTNTLPHLATLNLVVPSSPESILLSRTPKKPLGSPITITVPILPAQISSPPGSTPKLSPSGIYGSRLQFNSTFISSPLNTLTPIRIRLEIPTELPEIKDLPEAPKQTRPEVLPKISKIEHAPSLPSMPSRSKLFNINRTLSTIFSSQGTEKSQKHEQEENGRKRLERKEVSRRCSEREMKPMGMAIRTNPLKENVTPRERTPGEIDRKRSKIDKSAKNEKIEKIEKKKNKKFSFKFSTQQSNLLN